MIVTRLTYITINDVIMSQKYIFSLFIAGTAGCTARWVTDKQRNYLDNVRKGVRDIGREGGRRWTNFEPSAYLEWTTSNGLVVVCNTVHTLIKR